MNMRLPKRFPKNSRFLREIHRVYEALARIYNGGANQVVTAVRNCHTVIPIWDVLFTALLRQNGRIVL